jgi:dihydrofolate reductase
MTVNAIVACDTEHGIGKNGGLPWPYHPEDMKWFRDNTIGDVVVMGRKTWQSIGCMRLPKRVNVILSKYVSSLYGIPDLVYDVGPNEEQSMLQNLQMEHPNRKIWIIGGGNIYKQMLPYCENLYLTKFKESYDCDTFLDPEQLKPFIRLVDSKNTEACSFTIWSRI